MNRNDYDDFLAFTRWAIVAATVARLAQDRIASGRGAPSENDVIDYAEEGGSVADLLEEALKRKEADHA